MRPKQVHEAQAKSMYQVQKSRHKPGSKVNIPSWKTRFKARGTEIGKCKERKQTHCSQHPFTPFTELNNHSPVQTMKRGIVSQVPWLTFIVPASSQPYLLLDQKEEAVIPHLCRPAAAACPLLMKLLGFPDETMLLLTLV